MADLLKIGSDWLAAQFKAFASQTVTYVRGDSTVSVSATVGRTLLKLSDETGGVRMEWTDRDYLIQAAELVIGGVPIEPRQGDKIRETVGTTVNVYEVLAPGNEPVWRWSDGYGKVRRIHAKHVDTEEA